MNSHIILCTACDGKLSTIEGLFSCLENQTRLPEKILLLVYIQQTSEQFDDFVAEVYQYYPTVEDRLEILSAHNSSHQPGKFHGYDRQFLIEHSGNISSSRAKRGILGNSNQGEDIHYLTLMLDIDNEVESDFVASLLEEYNELSEKENEEILLAPTVMRRRSGRMQSQGIQGYSFLIPKYRFASFTKENSPQQVMIMGGNCLFGKTEIFQKIGFDSEFAWSYEDIDFTYRLRQSGTLLYVTAITVTYHMESERSILDHKLIGNPTSAYYRMRNYLLFVKKNATWWQKIQAYGFGVWGLYGWFVLNVLMYGGKKRWELVKGLSRGLVAGFNTTQDVTKEQKL